LPATPSTAYAPRPGHSCPRRLIAHNCRLSEVVTSATAPRDGTEMGVGSRPAGMKPSSAGSHGVAASTTLSPEPPGCERKRFESATSTVPLPGHGETKRLLANAGDGHQRAPGRCARRGPRSRAAHWRHGRSPTRSRPRGRRQRAPVRTPPPRRQRPPPSGHARLAADRSRSARRDLGLPANMGGLAHLIEPATV